jgi:hypothetical protein
MSLVTFAVIGKDNAPLYIRDFDDPSTTHFFPKDSSTSSSSGSDFCDDPFGFLEHLKVHNGYSSLKNQV